MQISDLINAHFELVSNAKVIAVGSSAYGKVFIRANKTMGFNMIECNLQYEIKGMFSVGKEVVKLIKLDRNKKYIEGKSYEYDINFDINNEPVSFNGTNLEIVWSLLIIATFDEGTRSELRSQFLKDASFKSIFKSFSGKLKEKIHLKVHNENPKYEIEEFTKSVESNTQIYTIIGGCLLAVTGYFYMQGIVDVLFYISLSISLLVFLYSLYKRYSIGTLGTVTFFGYALNQDYFEIQLKIQKNHNKIHAINTYYTINEEVIDDRGTGSTTYRETIFSSSNTQLKEPISMNSKVKMKYPDQDLPIGFKKYNARIYTSLHIDFEFSNGLSYKMKEDFVMTKRKPIYS